MNQDKTTGEVLQMFARRLAACVMLVAGVGAHHHIPTNTRRPAGVGAAGRRWLQENIRMFVVTMACTLLASVCCAQGRAVGWGGNVFDSDLESYNDIVDISAGMSHSLALRANGEILAWGENSNGCPVGACDVPPLPSGLRYEKIAAGNAVSVAWRSDGTFQAWGDCLNGVLNVPTVSGLACTEIRVSNFALALMSDGSVLAWGNNSQGQCNVPSLPPGVRYTKVAAGSANGVALRSDNTLVAWGNGSSGLMNTPAVPPGLAVVSLDAAGHAIAVLSDGSFLGWGSNSWGELAIQSSLQCEEVSVGSSLTLVRHDGGQLRAYGYFATSGVQHIPQFPFGATCDRIAVGWNHCVALLSNGQIRCWGGDGYLKAGVRSLEAGQSWDQVRRLLGDDQWVVAELYDGTYRPVAKRSYVPLGVTKMAVAVDYAVAARVDNTITVLGMSAGYFPSTPSIPSGRSVVQMETAGYHCLALLDDGQILAMGRNQYGQCNVPSPPTGTSPVKIAVSGSHCLAMTNDGRVYAWGANNLGQCQVPALPQGVHYLDCAAGGGYSMALRSDGVIQMWGSGSMGLSSVPSPIPSDPFVSIQANLWNASALRQSGGRVIWGDTDYRRCSPPPSHAGMTTRFLAAGYCGLALHSSMGTSVRYGQGCSGSRQAPSMQATGLPTVGGVQSAVVSDVPFNFAFLITGLSNTSGSIGPLPFELTSVGMPGCFVLVSNDVTQALYGSGESVSFSRAIPPWLELVGLRIFDQCIAPDFLASNAAKAVVSDALESCVGL